MASVAMALELSPIAIDAICSADAAVPIAIDSLLPANAPFIAAPSFSVANRLDPIAIAPKPRAELFLPIAIVECVFYVWLALPPIAIFPLPVVAVKELSPTATLLFPD